jgi:hypothetical protein
VTLCAVQRIISYDRGIDYLYPIPNERTLILTDDVDVSHPEGDAYIDEQRVTLCAD